MADESGGSNTFRYVLIPSDEERTVEALTGDTSGGLTDDDLIKRAKAYFEGITKERADGPDATATSGGSTTCDIMALTIPTEKNGYHACSMYVADHGKEYGMTANNRAASLLAACGHGGNAVIYGDVFVGRAYDNEMSEHETWRRVDFTVDDASPASNWCRVARSPGGGGGSGKSAASSLSGLVHQNANQMQIIDGGGGGSTGNGNNSTAMFGYNGAPAVKEPWGEWTQNDDEVELKLLVPCGTKSRDCNVKFGKNSVSVAVSNNLLLQGETFDPISTEYGDCTFTLQDMSASKQKTDDGNKKRELCVTLAKTESRTWPWVVIQQQPTMEQS